MTDPAEYSWHAGQSCGQETLLFTSGAERNDIPIGRMYTPALAEHVAAAHNAELVRRRLHALPWRTGRHEDRHVYALLGSQASDGDPIVGTLDTAEAAKAASAAHNEALVRHAH